MRLIYLIPVLFISCGTKNAADCEVNTFGTCSPQTEEEIARQDLNDGKYDDAVTRLVLLVEQKPEEYRLRTLLSAGYAASAGFNLLDSVKDQLSSSKESSGSKDIFQTLDKFIPSPKGVSDAAFKEKVTRMKSAVTTLEVIPAEKRQLTGEERYARSAALQLGLYQAAYSVMYLNQFLYSNGTLDISKLATMSADDALVVVRSLIGAGSAISGQSDSKLSQSITKTTTNIDAQTGSNDKEKLTAYVQSTQSK